jgi:phage-related tail fiber protein
MYARQDVAGVTSFYLLDDAGEETRLRESLWKYPCRATGTAALPAYTRTGNTLLANANGTLAAQDGVTLAVDDRFLVRFGAAGADNGIYRISNLGSGSTKWQMIRTDDAGTSLKVRSGMRVAINEGTQFGDTEWRLTTNDPITLNTTALVFQPLPGTKIKRTEFTSDVSITGTGFVDVVSSGAVAYDGNPIKIEFSANSAICGGNGNLRLEVLDGGTSIGRLASFLQSSTQNGLYFVYYLTPSAGSHTFKIAAQNTVAQASTIGAGAGGASTFVPGWIRISYE